jgi:4'-phosphopantetheinyl transferase
VSVLLDRTAALAAATDEGVGLGFSTGLPVRPLGTVDVHVHVFGLDVDSEFEAVCFAALSPTERVRCRQFRFDVHRRRYAVSRRALRAALAQHTACASAALRFGSGRFGRPYLENHGAAHDFSLSHAEELMVLAVSAQAAVGIDLESYRRPELSELRAQLACESEAQAIDALPQAQRQWALGRLWCAKEAVMKVNGTGLQLEPLQIEVAWAQTHGWARADCAPVVQECALQALEIAPGFSCVLACAATARVHLHPQAWSSFDVEIPQ